MFGFIKKCFFTAMTFFSCNVLKVSQGIMKSVK